MWAKQLLLYAIVGLICFVHGNFGHQFIPQREGSKAEEANKSFRFPSGDIVDCISIYKQPAFDHPLLKNHTLQRRPTIIPTDLDINESNDGIELTSSSSNDDELCPKDTVPIRRTNRKYDDPNNYKFAYVNVICNENDMFYGAGARIRADNPKCKDGQTSGATIWVGSDFSDQKNFLKAGWMVNPKIYGDTLSRIFIHWTADGFHRTGCYDLQCPGFIQVDTTAVLGSTLSQISGDQIYETYFYVFQDRANKNWWLVLTDHKQSKFVGYWASELVPRLGRGATVVHFGGSTSAHPGQRFPPMGNGRFPSNNYETSTYFRLMKYVNKTNYLIPPHAAETYTDNPNCYRVQYDDEGTSLMGHALYMGGSGGAC